MSKAKNKRCVVIALGSNEGNSEGNSEGSSEAILLAAVEQIKKIDGLSITALSNTVRSQPAYFAEQPDFYNSVLIAELDANLQPQDLLQQLQAIERDFGRTREPKVANGSRPLDLDIIDIEGALSDDPELLLPHPLALERDFVVTPLLEIAPNYVLANGTPVVHNKVNCGYVRNGDATGPDSQSTPPLRIDARPLLDAATGRLSVCATPIGNLGDITLRAIETLSVADAILAEDTRVTRRLLTHLNIAGSKLERCDENVIRKRTPQLLERLAAGEHLAYVSDAGTPGISDPGISLVAAARAANIRVDVLPGASALTCAVAASGIEGDELYFGGFLPRKQAQVRKLLQGLEQLDAVLVFYESPHRTATSLASIAELLPNRQVALCRELTKLHEEVTADLAPALAQQIAERTAKQPLKGEVVLVIARRPAPPNTQKTHIDKYAST